jgi:hypothetical protein
MWLTHDLKYMARPAVVPTIIQETDFLDRLLKGLAHFQFIDQCECPTSMQPYDKLTQMIIVN